MKTNAINYLNGLITDNTTKKEIDLISFIKKCVNEYKMPEKQPKIEWNEYFETCWKIYPRKIDKIRARKEFGKRMLKCKNQEEAKEFAKKIYKAEMLYIKDIERIGTEIEYIKHFATFLNANVPK